MRKPPLRIGIISQWYDPEPVPLPHDIAKALRGRGHSVRVLTAFPNYPNGKLYEGYKQARVSIENIDGIRVYRRPLIPSHDDSAAGRASNYLSYAATASAYINVLRGADVIFVYGTPLTAAIPAMLANALHGIPFVLQVQDLWPDSVTASGMLNDRLSRLVSRSISIAATHVYKRAAGNIAISEAMADELIRRGAAAQTTYAIHNWSSHEDSVVHSPSDCQTVTRFLYAGNLGEMQDLATLIRAAAIAQQHCSLEVVLVGDGVMAEPLQALAREVGAYSVSFKPRVPPSEMAHYYSEADFALVTLRDLPVFSMTVPSKFQAALARGVPVISTVPGEVSRICNQRRCGLTARPEDPSGLADALQRAAQLNDSDRMTLGANARATYESLFERDSAIARIESVLYSASSK